MIEILMTLYWAIRIVCTCTVGVLTAIHWFNQIRFAIALHKYKKETARIHKVDSTKKRRTVSKKHLLNKNKKKLALRPEKSKR